MDDKYAEIIDDLSLNEILAYKFECVFDKVNGCKENNHNLYEILFEIFEKELLKTCYEKNNCNQKKAAQVLGINRNTLRKKLLKYNIIE